MRRLTIALVVALAGCTGPTRVRITLPGGGTVTGPFDGPPLYDFVPRCDNPSEPSFMELL